MLGKKEKKVYISCCSHQKPEWTSTISINSMILHASKNGITSTFRPRVGESLICRARNNEVVEFLRKPGYEYMFTVDDDLIFPPDALAKLIKADKDIVGGIYRLKQDDPALAQRLPRGGPNWKEVLGKELITPAIYVSTGCMLVKRRVLEDMIDRYPELHYKRNVTADKGFAFFMPMIYDGEYLSEDWSFLQRARDAGFEVWAHGGVRCGHWGRKLYTF